jgi:hypothetical protein
MPDIQMTSMASELGSAPAMQAVQAAFVRAFRAAFGYEEVRAGEEWRA